jgi:DNA repair photolyase
MSDPSDAPPRRGRGVAGNPGNRFDGREHRAHDDLDPAQDPDPRTVFLDDDTQEILSRNDSDDVVFRVGVNPYRGCEHGCSYCYARTYHEYLGLSAGLDFESRILVKRRAPELLERALSRPSWHPQTIGMSGATDCYQPVERRLRLTRGCVAVLARLRNPLALITKNALVARDADLFATLAVHQAVSVTISLTTLRPDLSQSMEPRASVPEARLSAMRALTQAGVPVGVLVAPLVPGLTDHELPAILAAAAAAGARHAGYQVLRLPGAVEGLFTAWLRHHHPTHADKVLKRIRSLHGGSCDAPPGRRNAGGGVWATEIHHVFELARRKAGLSRDWPTLSTAAFLPPHGRQTTIFESFSQPT